MSTCRFCALYSPWNREIRQKLKQWMLAHPYTPHTPTIFKLSCFREARAAHLTDTFIGSYFVVGRKVFEMDWIWFISYLHRKKMWTLARASPVVPRRCVKREHRKFRWNFKCNHYNRQWMPPKRLPPRRRNPIGKWLSILIRHRKAEVRLAVV